MLAHRTKKQVKAVLKVKCQNPSDTKDAYVIVTLLLLNLHGDSSLNTFFERTPAHFPV
jgi:hypothetical protein